MAKISEFRLLSRVCDFPWFSVVWIQPMVGAQPMVGIIPADVSCGEWRVGRLSYPRTWVLQGPSPRRSWDAQGKSHGWGGGKGASLLFLLPS